MPIKKQNIEIPLFSCFYTFVLRHILHVSLRCFRFYIFCEVLYYDLFVKRWYLKIYRQYGFSRLTRLSTAYR